MPFTVTWMDIEITILSKVSQREKDKYHMVWFKCEIKRERERERETNELISKTKKDSQTQKTNVWLPKGKVAEDKLRDQN